MSDRAASGFLPGASPQEAALAYAARGWPVFPCDGEKHPLTAHGFKDASVEEAAVRSFWKRHPGARVGIATGGADLVAIDVDVKQGAPGLQSWRALVEDIGEATEDTAITRTPSGGLHIYYRCEHGLIASSVGKLAPGIDVRARGGYVIAPPSTNSEGVAYEWLAGHGPEHLAPLPAALAARLLEASAVREMPGLEQSRVIAQGARNSSLASLAGSMRCRGMTEAAIFAALLSENQERCDPPLPDDEVRTIVASVAGYPPGSPEADGDDPLAGLEALARGAGAQALEEALRGAGRWATRLDALGRETLRERAIARLKELGVSRPARLVDAAFAVGQRVVEESGPSGGTVLFREVEAWPEPVDGVELLAEVNAALRRHVVIPEAACLAVALWIVLAHCYESFSVLPMLALVSAVKRSGKTLLLTLIAALVPRALPASNISPAALFRSVEKYRPTLLIDEVDTFLRDNAELNGILNSGHTRSLAHVVRTVGDEHEPRCFSTWCPKVYAGIGHQRGTLEDRAIVISLRRRAPGEPVARLRLDRLAEFEPLRRRIARWAEDQTESLSLREPLLPELVSDRAADNWRPLLSIAEAIGGGWAERARAAALELTEGNDDEGDARVLLLADLRDLFRARACERLASAEIVAHLAEMEERPWPEWRGDKPITSRQVARLLGPFGVAPTTMRFETGTKRGYTLAQCADTFARYLPSASATAATCLQRGGFASATPEPAVAPENGAICRDVALVADERPEWSGEL